MPNSLMLCATGQLTICPSSYSRATNKELVPPEYYLSGFNTDAAVEKVCQIFFFFLNNNGK